MNSLNAIVPYRRGSVWVFDDEAKGLSAEPFGNVNHMINHLAELVGSDEITLLFSDKSFPDYQLTLHRLAPHSGGEWYDCPRIGLHGWLCPVLFKYFKEALETIYVQAVKL